MLIVALYVLGIAANPLDSIIVRNFFLETDEGENVLHQHFDRRRLADSSVERLALKFNALGEQFNFEFERSHPIFEPGLTIKMAGRVREHTEVETSAITESHAFVAQIGRRLR